MYGKRFTSRLIVVLSLAVFIAAGGFNTKTYAAGPTAHTKQEIINYLKSNNVSINDPVTYATTPVLNTNKGSLSYATRQSALKMLNNVRYIAGVNPVLLDTTYDEKAQAGAFSNYVINDLTHYPGTTNGKEEGPTRPKPEGMSDADWNDGKEGAASSNMGAGYSTLNRAIVKGWLEDADEDNIDRLGHRRWCLNPKMGETGFGKAGPYVAMWAIDTSGSGSQTKVAWPAQKMPVEFFGKDYPWSLSVGSTVTKSKVKVDLTRTSSSPSGYRKWSFAGSGSYTASDTGLYFNVENSNYGQPGCIIFRPDGISEYKPGDTFNVSITGVGSETIAYTVEFFNGYKIDSLAFDQNTYYFTTYEKRVSPTTAPADASGYDITWRSADPSIASVDSDGYVTGHKEGQSTTITATIPGEYTTSGASITASYTAYVSKSIREGEGMSIQITSPRYTGDVVSPTVVVKDGNTVLVEGVDYTISYPENLIEPTDSNQIVWIYGKGKYYDNTGRLFYVNKQLLSNCDIQLSNEQFVYNGNLQKPTVTVKNGNLTLKEGVDYTLTNNGGTGAGSYSISIKSVSGSKYYTGTASKTYEIKQKDINDCNISVSSLGTVYRGEVNQPTVSISDGTTSLVKGTDYQLDTGQSINAGYYNYTIEGCGNYTGTKTGEFNIKPCLISSPNVSISMMKDTYEYSGNQISPEIKVTFTTRPSGRTVELVKGTDYDVEVESGPAVNRGTYTVTIKGLGGNGKTGNFTGSTTRELTISPKALASDMIDLSSSSFVYNREQQKPSVAVRNGATQLQEGAEYTLVNEGGIEAGTYSVTVSAKANGNYSGTATASYSIEPMELRDGMLRVYPSNTEFTGRYYNGKSTSPKLYVKHEETDPGYLKEGTDYIVSKKGIGENVGTYTASILGTGNYKGNASASYEIRPKSINDSDVEFDETSAEYTGTRITPVFNATFIITRTNNGQTTTETAVLKAANYDVEYKDAGDGIEPGVYEVIITGKNNFTGSRTGYFEIKPRSSTPVNPESGSSDGTDVNAAIDDYIRNNSIDRETAAITESMITSGNTDADLRGSRFSLLRAYAKKNTKKSVSIRWSRIAKADGYVVYGNLCGAGNKCRRLGVITGNGATSFTHKGLKKGKYYKYVVIAYKNIGGRRLTVAASPTIHSVTKGGKYGVAKSVKITKVGKKKGAKATIKLGKTAKIKAKEVKADKRIKKHRGLCYESGNPGVATVSKKGVIKAVRKGKCNIYVYAQNGVSKVVKVTVK